MYASDGQKSPGRKLLLAILIGVALAVPLFSVWLLVYDRQTQSNEARASITEGWGDPQAISGPVLVIPYRTTSTETSVAANNATVSRTREVIKELMLEPEEAQIQSNVKPELRKRSIDPQLARRRTEHGSGLGVFRWVVERFFGWLHRFRKLRLRTDRYTDNHRGLLQLACALICLRFL